MAIPPSPGKFSPEEVQIALDKVKADVQVIESKLAAMKDYPEHAKPKVEGKDNDHKAEAKGHTYGVKK